MTDKLKKVKDNFKKIREAIDPEIHRLKHSPFSIWADYKAREIELALYRISIVIDEIEIAEKKYENCSEDERNKDEYYKNLNPEQGAPDVSQYRAENLSSIYKILNFKQNKWSNGQVCYSEDAAGYLSESETPAGWSPQKSIKETLSIGRFNVINSLLMTNFGPLLYNKTKTLSAVEDRLKEDIPQPKV